MRIGWLDSRHTFSFGDYHDPRHMQWGSLRVINEDHVAPGAGFPPHPHRDMEIVTWVLDGALAHKDSTGGQSIIRPGEVQRMTAGTGIRHSEFNASVEQEVHLLQIWLLPAWTGLAPGYEQKSVSDSIDGRLRLIGSGNGREGSVTIHQDVDLYATRLKAGGQVELGLRPGRLQWVQIARGAGSVNGAAVRQGDGAAVQDETVLTMQASEDVEALVFDMAA